VFIGTPKGKNLFYELYCKGQDQKETEYISYQFESRKSEKFPPSEWEAVQRLPQRVFEQEYQAKFLDLGGEVFRNIADCIRGQLEPDRNVRKTYYCGVDLAKSYDYTVICILDNNGHLVFFVRFNEISWNIQKERIKRACQNYDALAWIDSTGVGDPIFEDLAQQVRAQGYKFTNVSKRQLIEGLSVSIERGEISFPEIPELINELSIFSFEQSETGTIKYSAPSGMHDDIVIALALANYGYGQNRGFEGAISSDGERESLIQAW
jgi:phage FluMu gp28-like protein